MSRIVVIGELNPDLILANYSSFPEAGKEIVVEDCTLTLGSASAICAMALAKLGNEVRFVSQVGQDLYGAFCLDLLRAAGIDITYVEQSSATKTGITVSVSSSKDRALITYPGALTTFEAAHVTPEIFGGFEHLHMSSYFLQPRLRPRFEGLFRAAGAQGLTTSLDPGFDPTESWGMDLVQTLNAVDVFFPNEVELRGLTGDDDIESAVKGLANGRTLTVAKLGAQGCTTLAGDCVVRQGPFPVEAFDTTGAGDTFNAGFLHAWLKKEPLPVCLRWGAACGALSTLGPGIGSQPTAERAEKFLNLHRETQA